MRSKFKETTTISGRPVAIGGQHVGTVDSTVIVENIDIGLRIEMSAYRSQHENREKALLLMNMIIEDVVE